jgi:hypothetical protein
MVLEVDGLLKKENPGVGRGVSFEYQYSWLDGRNKKAG